MWTPFRNHSTRRARLAACALAVACSKAPAHIDASVQQSAVASPATGCGRDSLHPSAAPPAQGMWTSEGSPDNSGVAAMIGPAEVRTGSTVVTRTIETVEGANSPSPLRTRLDDAVVRLELVPRFLGEHRGPVVRSSSVDELEPAAAYLLTPLVALVSYEACVGPPAVRYLRRDSRGGIASDAMLRRASALK